MLLHRILSCGRHARPDTLVCVGMRRVAAMATATLPEHQESYYRRALPEHLISFTSDEGKALLKEAIHDGAAESLLNLVGNFTTQSELACRCARGCV